MDKEAKLRRLGREIGLKERSYSIYLVANRTGQLLNPFQRDFQFTLRDSPAGKRFSGKQLEEGLRGKVSVGTVAAVKEIMQIGVGCGVSKGMPCSTDLAVYKVKLKGGVSARRLAEFYEERAGDHQGHDPCRANYDIMKAAENQGLVSLHLERTVPIQLTLESVVTYLGPRDKVRKIIGSR